MPHGKEGTQSPSQGQSAAADPQGAELGGGVHRGQQARAPFLLGFQFERQGACHLLQGHVASKDSTSDWMSGPHAQGRRL